ncbi:MAG: hypothetical protein LUG45_00935 [Clostridiales bacterium]|nr:hypothetical protein [Clostridiales bacterium]
MVNTQEQINTLRQDVTELQSIIRIGKVTSRNTDSRTVKVSWSNGAQSASLHVLIHDAEEWMPEVGQTVACLHRPGGDGDGYILGAL